MKTKSNLLTCLLLSLFTSFSLADEAFVTELNSKWQAKHASNLIAYLDLQLIQTPQEPQVLFARAVVAAELEQWGRGATNYLQQALNYLELSTEYSVANKEKLIYELNEHFDFYSQSITHFNEPNPSYPQSNTVWQEEIFAGGTSDFPYMYFFEKV